MCIESSEKNQCRVYLMTRRAVEAREQLCFCYNERVDFDTSTNLHLCGPEEGAAGVDATATEAADSARTPVGVAQCTA